LVLAPAALAQDATPESTPVASPVADQAAASITGLYSLDVDPFPAAPMSVRLLRLTLAPGASSPMHTHPGHEIDLVESGTLTVDTDGDASVITDGEPTTGVLAGEQLGAGQIVHFPAGTGMFLQNTSVEDVVLLSAVFHPVNEDLPTTEYADGNPPAESFEGVSFTVLGDGIIETFPEGPATISLVEIAAPAGAPLPASDGASMYSLVDGEFAFAVQDGSVQVSRSASPGLRPDAAQGQEFTLSTGDAAFFPNGVTETDRANQGGDLSLLRLTAVSAAGPQEGAASISFLETEAVDGGAASGEIGVGAIVVINTDSVNMRTEATTGSDVVQQLDTGTEVAIIGGPEEADDFTWWQVQLVDDESVNGWVAEDFLSLPDSPEAEQEPEATEEPAEDEAEATPEAEGTPDAAGTPEAVTDADFQVGDIVATTEENVRIREEPTTVGEPFDVFPAGTEFEVTGEPTEADDFTWYPVTQVDDESISGWIASDFLEPAPEDDEE
jgi:quercetin dioxygenase-like cupin family protein/uncharacterized protein YgiM (DUF1202 family)